VSNDSKKSEGSGFKYVYFLPSLFEINSNPNTYVS